MSRRAARSVALCGVVLCFVTACGGEGGGGGGEGGADRPSVTGSVSPTRTPPSPTRSVSVPEQSESEPAAPRPSRSPGLSPDATRTSEPDATATFEPEPEPTSAGASPSTDPAEEGGGEGSAEESASTAAWVALVLLVVLALLATWMVLRARRRGGWHTRLEAAEAEVAWFARDLVPQLRTAASADQAAGGWQVARPRIASAEDQLTVLESAAPGDRETERARLLRDAVRSARQKLDQMAGPGVRDPWALELDAVSDLLELALGPPVDSTPT